MTSVWDPPAFHAVPDPVKNFSADPDTASDQAHKKCKVSSRDIRYGSY